MMNKKRRSWDSYFMNIAVSVAVRGTCDRAHVGCVITVDKHIVSTGYNGSIPGAQHCDDIGHMMVDGHCVRTIHAEQNAILQAVRSNVSLCDATLYTTHFPCWNCCKLICGCGIKRVVYKSKYGDDNLSLLIDDDLLKIERCCE
jgi:dCMP deaminase